MERDFIREQKIIDKTDKQKENELIVSIINTRRELIDAHKKFDFAEGELIDYYTYKIKASQAKLDYLTKQAKSMGLMLEYVNGVYFRLNGKEAI